MSSNIIRVMKSRKMRWAGHVAYLREKRNAIGVLVGKPEKRGYLEDLGIDGRVCICVCIYIYIKHLEERNGIGGHGLA